VHELFEQQVRKTPDAIAAISDAGSMNYRELNRRANRLAHALRELRVGPDIRVGLCVERGLEMMVGLLGVLKAGGAYVPLDPAYPAQRLQFMLEDSGAMVLLTQAHLLGLFAGIEIGVSVVELEEKTQQGNNTHNHEETDLPPHILGLTCNHLAYVI